MSHTQRRNYRLHEGARELIPDFPLCIHRGVTIEIGIDSFATPHRKFTLIDAPGHRDFIPNMISGAAQADTALLVVDASRGGFESGFGEGGQTREHALLVRSFGVQQLVVAVNKLDAVGWDQTRYDEICAQLQPFLIQAGFKESRLTFIPCGAMTGENLIQRRTPELEAWYSGQTVIQRLDTLAVPERALEAPLRIPVANVFRGQTSGLSGLGVSGRIESGIVQVGERLAVLPGDETGVVKSESGRPAPRWDVAMARSLTQNGCPPLRPASQTSRSMVRPSTTLSQEPM